MFKQAIQIQSIVFPVSIAVKMCLMSWNFISNYLYNTSIYLDVYTNNLIRYTFQADFKRY